MNNIIEQLRNDNEYYFGIGRNYLSNSDIATLLTNPVMYGVKQEPTLAMLQGTYFHHSCLEPHKVKDFPYVSASTRTTNIYKDACKEYGVEYMLLEKEIQEVDSMVKALRNNKELSKLVWDNGVRYETPYIGTIMGKEWKGKVDIENGNFIYDLKTTTNIDDFKYSAKKYNYDSQTAIYEELTGLTLAFIVIEKGSNRLGIFHPSDEFRNNGWQKIQKAVEVHSKFFGSNPSHDVSQYYTEQYLF